MALISNILTRINNRPDHVFTVDIILDGYRPPLRRPNRNTVRGALGKLARDEKIRRLKTGGYQALVQRVNKPVFQEPSPAV
jgi:hypothetical protein